MRPKREAIVRFIWQNCRKTNGLLSPAKPNGLIAPLLFLFANSYNGKDRLPVLFFFDPHGDGSLPLKNYQSLANNYGYILVGSNNIKNGLSGSYAFSVFQQLLNETQSRFLIDNKRIFTSGFSGGAKLAIIFAQQLPQIAGVIACGGSIPFNGDELTRFYYVGMVGLADFNYLEAQQSFSAFDQKGIDYTAITFAGKHEWPPVAEFNLAFSGLELFCMKTNRTPKNEKWMNTLWNQMQDSINDSEKKQNYIAELLTLRQTERWFNGIRNISDIKIQQATLEQNPQFIKQVTKRQALLQKEIALRSEFIKAIELRDLEWWRAEVTRFNETTSNSDKEVALIGRRLLNYLSMVSFMFTKNDLDDGKLDDAFKKIQIYALVDATNPDVYLMYARYYLLSGDKKLMVENFKKALSLGFVSWEQYASDNSWKALFAESEIQQLKTKD
ncbi:MAG: hypothetical protein WCX31_06855 [Salinivirgaceae bacterium]